MKTWNLTIPTLLGTENIVANEVRALGYETSSVTDGRVNFIGDAEAVALSNIHLRSAERVLVRLTSFPATSFEELFERTKAFGWEEWIGKEDAFPVTGNSLKSALHHIPSCQSIIKKAVATRLSSVYKVERLEELKSLYPIRFSIYKDEVTLYLDTSGASLYKRGWRTESVLAPMRETLAYAMIDMSFWRGDRPLMDPFSGSGTIPVEAAMYACHIAPGLRRHFTAETWTEKIPKEIWKDVREEAKEQIDRSVETEIYASDIDPEAVEIAKENARRAGVDKKIRFAVSDMARVKPFAEKGCIICNPPYGERLLDQKACEALYRKMGRKFAEFPQAKKLILTSHEKFEACYGRPADKRRKVYNGMLKCYVYQYFK